MRHPLTARRARRVAASAIVGVLAASAAVLAPAPAGAAPAPLLTEDGLGVRIDENAILGVALEAIEDEMQIYVDGLIQQGAEDNSVMDDPDWVWTDSNLELGFDFVNAGTAGYPQGGLKVDAQIQDIRMQFYRYGEWWQPECLIEVNPDTSYINASAYVDTSKLPNAPLTINPITATWDEDPDHTIVVGNWLCNGYLIDEWWEGLWGSGSDTAAGIEAELNGVAQDLVDGLWADYVVPVLADLNAFGITFSDIHTDDHGLIVKADVDATNGLTIPGVGGPFDVSGAVDSGADSDVDALLAQRGGDVIASIHPNVVNQFMNALYQVQNGNIAAWTLLNGTATEEYLLPPANRGTYNDSQWSLTTSGLSTFYTEPTGTGGAPQLNMPTVRFRFGHPQHFFGLQPVATFNGSISEVDLITEIRTAGDAWGPALDGSGLSVSATLSTVAGQTIAPVVTWNPDPAGLVGYAQESIVRYNQTWLVDFLSLAPIEIAGFDLDLCTTCGRYSGDERYTETFNLT